MATTDTFSLTKEWVLAGHAIFTVSNASGDHYTFCVRQKEADPKRVNPRTGLPWTDKVWFVSVLAGPENTTDYAYLGMLCGVDTPAPWVKATKASKLPQDSKPYAVARWALNMIWNGTLATKLPPGYAVSHAGRCGRCGRLLTHPDGVADNGYRHGFGPECWEKMMSGVVE